MHVVYRANWSVPRVYRANWSVPRVYRANLSVPRGSQINSYYFALSLTLVVDNCVFSVKQ